MKNVGRFGVPLGAQEADADPQERCQQHDVAEVRQVQHVGPEPSDQRQLQQEHERAGHDEAKARRGDHPAML